MIVLKQVIHDIPTNSVEATWVDEEGKQVRCHSYADRQMQLFRDHAAIAGTPLTDYEALIALVESNIQPIPPPTAEEIAAKAQRVADRDAIINAKADATIQYLVSHTPAQIVAKVQADVTDLASAKVMLARLAVAIGAGLRRELR